MSQTQSIVGFVHDIQISLPGLDLTHRNLVVVELKMTPGLHDVFDFAQIKTI
jgi:hypothetical protein